MQKERKEEMKLFLLPALFGCWVANPNKVKAGRESSQSSHWCTGQAEGNSTAGREILCFSGHQEALLGWYNTAMPCPSPHLGKSFHLLLFLGYSWVSCAWSCEQIEFPQVGKALRMSLNIQIFLLFSQQQLLSSFVSAQGFSRNAGE